MASANKITKPVDPLSTAFNQLLQVSAGERYSKRFTSKLPEHAAAFETRGITFVKDVNDLAKMFSEHWSETKTLIPKTVELETSIEASDELAADEINSILSQVLRHLSLNDLASFYATKLRCTAAVWTAVMQRFLQHLPNHRPSDSPECQPLKRFMVAMAQITQATDPNSRMTAYAGLAAAMWPMMREHRNSTVPSRLVGRIAVQLVLEELESGCGHASALLRNCSLDNEQLTQLLFPSEQLANQLTFVEEITVKGVLAFSGISSGNVDTLELFKREKATAQMLAAGTFSYGLAGDFYLDAATDCRTPGEAAFVLLAAAKCYLKEFQVKESLAERFALKKLLLEVLSHSWRLAFTCAMHAYTGLHVSGTAFAIVRRMLLQSPSIAQQEDVDAMCCYFARFADYARFVPLPFTPNLLCCEAGVFGLLSGEIAPAFLLHAQPIAEAALPMSACFLHSEIFAHHVLDVCNLANPSTVRENAMESFLKHRRNGMTWRDVEAFIKSPLYSYDSHGFLTQTPALCGDLSNGVRGIRALKIDLKTGEVSFEFKQGNGPPLVNIGDLAAAMKLPGRSASFSLDNIEEDHITVMHPLQAIRFKPAELADTEFLHTMFLADYIMKQLSLGQEASYNAPFATRPLANSPLWKSLPAKLHEALAPVTSRAGFTGNLLAGFWIQAEVIEVTTHKNEEVLCVRFGDAKVSVRTGNLKPDAQSKLAYAKAEMLNPAQEQFAADLTRVYDELAQHYAAFARLKELIVVQLAADYIRSHSEDVARRRAATEQRVDAAWTDAVNAEERCVLSILQDAAKSSKCDDITDRCAVTQKFLDQGVSTSTASAWLCKGISDAAFARRAAEEIRIAADVRSKLAHAFGSTGRGLSKTNNVVPAVFQASEEEGGLVIYGGIVLKPKVLTTKGTASILRDHTWTSWQPVHAKQTQGPVPTATVFSASNSLAVPIYSTAPAWSPNGGRTNEVDSKGGKTDKQLRLEETVARGITNGKAFYMETGADSYKYVRRVDLSATTKADLCFKVAIGNERIPIFTPKQSCSDFIDDKARFTVRCPDSALGHQRFRNAEMLSLQEARVQLSNDIEAATRKRTVWKSRTERADGYFNIVAYTSKRTNVPSLMLFPRDGTDLVIVRYMHWMDTK